ESTERHVQIQQTGCLGGKGINSRRRRRHAEKEQAVPKSHGTGNRGDTRRSPVRAQRRTIHEKKQLRECKIILCSHPRKYPSDNKSPISRNYLIHFNRTIWSKNRRRRYPIDEVR